MKGFWTTMGSLRVNDGVKASSQVSQRNTLSAQGLKGGRRLRSFGLAMAGLMALTGQGFDSTVYAAPVVAQQTPPLALAPVASSGIRVAQAPANPAPAVINPAANATTAVTPAPAAPALSPNVSRRLPELKAFASRMQIPFEELVEGMNGLEMIYERRYADARQTFRDMGQKYPASAIGPFGLVMLAQAQMGESLDFLHDKVYTASYKESITRMDAAISRNEAVPWNRFLRGCAKGVNSLYLYRQDKVLGALTEGMGALSDIEAAKKLDPQFMDPYIGLGVYDYWRSSITLRYKNLPFFPDKREQGLRELEMARDKGVIAPTMARLALGYSYMDKRQNDKALREVNMLKMSYPQSVLALQLGGQVYNRLHLPKKARAAYEEVLALDSRNVLAHYNLGMMDMNRDFDYPSAVKHLEIYVQNLPSDFNRASAHTRLGDAYWLSGSSAKAEEQWRLALKAKPDAKMAQSRLNGKRPRAQVKKVAPVMPAMVPAAAPVTKPATALSPGMQVREAALKKAGIMLPMSAQ